MRVNFINFLSAYALGVWVLGCGLAEPEYTEYEGPSDGLTSEDEDGATDTATETDETTCEDQYLAAFGSVQTAIENSCGNAGCHGDGTGGGLTLAPGDTTANEAALWSFTGGDASKLVDKLNGTASHNGGVLIPSTLAESGVTSWHGLKNSNCE